MMAHVSPHFLFRSLILLAVTVDSYILLKTTKLPQKIYVFKFIAMVRIDSNVFNYLENAAECRKRNLKTLV